MSTERSSSSPILHHHGKRRIPVDFSGLHGSRPAISGHGRASRRVSNRHTAHTLGESQLQHHPSASSHIPTGNTSKTPRVSRLARAPSPLGGPPSRRPLSAPLSDPSPIRRSENETTVTPPPRCRRVRQTFLQTYAMVAERNRPLHTPCGRPCRRASPRRGAPRGTLKSLLASLSPCGERPDRAGTPAN